MNDIERENLDMFEAFRGSLRGKSEDNWKIIESFFQYIYNSHFHEGDSLNIKTVVHEMKCVDKKNTRKIILGLSVYGIIEKIPNNSVRFYVTEKGFNFSSIHESRMQKVMQNKAHQVAEAVSKRIPSL